MPRQPACLCQGAAQQELDLSVGAPQIITRPAGQSVMHGGIQPQQDAFALVHRDPPVPAVPAVKVR